MKERPILFSGPMVRALLEGRKTQTRRVISHQPDKHGLWPRGTSPGPDDCHYGQPGGLLWVRETWALEDCGDDGQRAIWQADRAARWLLDGEDSEIVYLPSNYAPPRWRPSIHMPRWASRLTLEVTEVRIQRLREITEEDARAEGVVDTSGAWGPLGDTDRAGPRGAFEALWDSINGAGAWNANPWVWAISFKVSDGGSKP